jgi:hypothetical protein
MIRNCPNIIFILLSSDKFVQSLDYLSSKTANLMISTRRSDVLELYKSLREGFAFRSGSVADPDPFDTDPDPHFTLIWILLSNLIRIRLFDMDPDPCPFKRPS